jgi:hypothetical protein
MDQAKLARMQASVRIGMLFSGVLESCTREEIVNWSSTGNE